METEIARGEKVKSFFTTITDGNGNKERVIDFDNEETCPKQGLIEVIPLKQRKGFDNNVKFRRVKDRITQCWIGIPEGIHDETKKITYQLITIVGNRVYDLSHEKDRKEWMCIKFSPYLEGSPNQDRNAPPIFKVYDKEKQAHENSKKRVLRRTAEQKAEGLSGDLLNDMLRVCGINAAGMSTIMKENAIAQFAESNPEEFLKHFESPTRRESFILKQAIEFDIVQNEPTVGFVYKTINMGINEQFAIEYLKEHSNISTAIETLIAMKKEDTVKSNTVVPKTDDSLEAAQREIAELKAKLAAQANVNIEAESGKSLEGNAPDPEFETLKAEAKDLKIKGWHVKSKETLEKEVEKEKAKKQ